MNISIGQLAKIAGSGIETIRFYERRGLIPDPPRAPSGYRLYAQEDVVRLRFIRRAKQLGFSLDEIGTLLALQDGGDRAEVKAAAKDKLAQIDSRIHHLQRMRNVLAELETQCSGTGPVAGCPIIDALNEEVNENE